MRVAALADVHGNAPALAAVLEEVEREQPDLVVFCGDLTWGSLPHETLAHLHARALETPARFVRGNADRAAGGTRSRPKSRGFRIERVESRCNTMQRTARILSGLRGDGARRGQRARPNVLLSRLPALRRGMRHRADTCESGFASSWPASMRARSSPGHVHVSYDRVDRWNPNRSGREVSDFRTSPEPGRALGAPRSRRRAPAHRLRHRGGGGAHARDGRSACPS